MNMRKSYQRKFNKLIRDLNTNITNDNLWKGRYKFRQIDAVFERFPDDSGGILHTVIRAVDVRTNYYKDYIIEYAPFLPFNNSNIFMMANTFITEDSRTWETSPKSELNYHTSTNYRGQWPCDVIWRASRNYYKQYSEDSNG